MSQLPTKVTCLTDFKSPNGPILHKFQLSSLTILNVLTKISKRNLSTEIFTFLKVSHYYRKTELVETSQII